MQVNRFDGGLSTRLDASLIEINEAVTYYNVDNTSGTLKSVKGPTKVSDLANPLFYLYKGTTLTSTSPRDYLEYNKSLYWTEDNGKPSKFNGVNTFSLGIARPAGEPAFDSNGDPIYGEDAAQIVGLVVDFVDFETSDFLLSVEEGTGSLAAGTYTYKLFVYSDNKLIYIIPHTITVAANTEVTFLTKSQYQIKLGKLDSGVYKQIATTTAGILRDNGQALGVTIPEVVTSDTITSQWVYTYYNSTEDIESAPSELTAEYEWPLAKKAKLSNFTASEDGQVDIIRLYRLAEPNTTSLMVEELSNIVDVYYDYKTNTQLTRVLESYDNIPPESGIKYLVEAYGILFAAKGNILYFSATGKPDYWPSGNQLDFGVEITGLLPIDAGILVFSTSRAKLLTGTDASTFAFIPVTDEQGCILHKSCSLVKNVPVWISMQGICAFQGGSCEVISKPKLGTLDLSGAKTVAVDDETYYIVRADGSLLSMDLRFGMVFKEAFLTFPIDDIGGFGGYLYGSSNNTLYKMFQGPPIEFSYLSPEYAEGSITITKLYNEFYIYMKGKLKIRILIDGKEVSETSYDMDDFGLRNVKISQERQRGSNIQFDIKGIGEVKEIEYKVVGRNNGR